MNDATEPAPAPLEIAVPTPVHSRPLPSAVDADGNPVDPAATRPAPAAGERPAIGPARDAVDEDEALRGVPRGDWTRVTGNGQPGTLGENPGAKRLRQVIIGVLLTLFFGPLLWMLLLMMTSLGHAPSH